jgi:hypothetical protein
MPRIPFDEENKREDPYKFPKLHLDHGEVARLMLPEVEPLAEFAHVITEPVLINGQGTRETRQTKGGEDYQVWKDRFVSRQICLGDWDTMRDKGIDPEHCPGCKAATQYTWMKLPERRFAMHVVRYELMPNSWEPVSPLAVRVLGWGFADSRYNEITGFKTTWGDLRARDLLCGPCENETYQKYKIQVAPDAIWLRSEEWKVLVSTTYRNNQYPALESLMGRRVTADVMNNDLAQATAKWNHVEGNVPGTDSAPSPIEVAAEAAGLDMDSLLNPQGPEAPQAAPTAPEPAPAVESVAAPSTAPEPAPVAQDDLMGVQPVTPDPPASGGSVDFDDLLNEIKQG